MGIPPHMYTGGGGGFTYIEGCTRCARKKTPRKRGILGVEAERADREKGVKFVRFVNLKCSSNCYDRSSSRAIYQERAGTFIKHYTF